MMSMAPKDSNPPVTLLAPHTRALHHPLSHGLDHFRRLPFASGFDLLVRLRLRYGLTVANSH